MNILWRCLIRYLVCCKSHKFLNVMKEFPGIRSYHNTLNAVRIHLELRFTTSSSTVQGLKL